MLAVRPAAVLLLTATAVGEHVRQYVSYTAGGVECRGFVSYDSSVCTSTSKCPGVAIVPNWDGMNQFEMDRACMLASMGYVAFAVDIYGVDIVNSWDGEGAFNDFMSASGMHIQDATLYMGKIMGAIDKLEDYDFVDSNKLAAIGYCFGGTGVMNLALAGYGGQYSVPDGLLGVVAYHGGERGLLNATAFSPSGRPQLLVHHGVADEAITSMTMAQMELDMEEAGAVYEVQRYGSGVGHGFTMWGGQAYEKRADRRSWSSTTSFLSDLFAGYDTPTAPGEPSDAMTKQAVSYTAGGVSCTGFLIYDPSKCTSTSKCPGVMVVPDWNGMNDYEKDRAHILAKLGYVAFAADIYGDDIINSWPATPSIPNFIPAASSHLQDATLYMSKIVGGLEQLSSYDFVDSAKLAAIGYCFGGTGVINLAIAGHGGTYSVPTGLLGVVAYHSGEDGLLDPTQHTPTSRPKLYIHQGRADPAISIETMTSLEEGMEAGNAEYDIVWYGNDVGHPFTPWDSPSYNGRADHRSWMSTVEFLEETFAGTADGSMQPSTCSETDADAASTPSLAACVLLLLIALLH